MDTAGGGRAGRVLVLAATGMDDFVAALADIGWRVRIQNHVSRAFRDTRLKNPDWLAVGPSACGGWPSVACWRSRLAGYTGPLIVALREVDDTSAADLHRAGADDVLFLPARSGEVILRARLAMEARGTLWMPCVRAGKLVIDCTGTRPAVSFRGQSLKLGADALASLAYVVFNGNAFWEELARQLFWPKTSVKIAQAHIRSALEALNARDDRDCPIQIVRGVGPRTNPDLPRQFFGRAQLENDRAQLANASSRLLAHQIWIKPDF